MKGGGDLYASWSRETQTISVSLKADVLTLWDPTFEKSYDELTKKLMTKSDIRKT